MGHQINKFINLKTQGNIKMIFDLLFLRKGAKPHIHPLIYSGLLEYLVPLPLQYFLHYFSPSVIPSNS